MLFLHEAQKQMNKFSTTFISEGRSMAVCPHNKKRLPHLAWTTNKDLLEVEEERETRWQYLVSPQQ